MIAGGWYSVYSTNCRWGFFSCFFLSTSTNQSVAWRVVSSSTALTRMSRECGFEPRVAPCFRLWPSDWFDCLTFKLTKKKSQLRDQWRERDEKYGWKYNESKTSQRQWKSLSSPTALDSTNLISQVAWKKSFRYYSKVCLDIPDVGGLPKFLIFTSAKEVIVFRRSLFDCLSICL